MCDFIELQNMGKIPYTNPSRFNTSTVTLSLRTIIISLVTLTVIFATLILTSIYTIHNNQQVKTQVSTLILSHTVNNLQQEYVEQMHQNISHNLFLDTKTLFQLHNSTKEQIMKTYDETEKISQETEAETVVIYRNLLSEKIEKSLIAIRHEQTFRKMASENWQLSNETEERIKELYHREFQAAVITYAGRDPPEVSSEFHRHIIELTLSKGVSLNIMPPSPEVLNKLKVILWEKYNKKLKDHAVIGIDFGESYIRSFVYADGNLKKCDKYVTYVGLEKYDGFSEKLLKYFVIPQADNIALPILYDLKEIIRAWNSFNASSNKLFWTFNVQKGTINGPTVSSPTTGIQHTVESVVAKLFQRVKEANVVGRCVITVPYDFTEDQKNLILDAGATAGFEEITLLDEDIAAAFTLEYVHGPWNASKNIMFLEFNQLSWKIYILVGYQSNFTRIVSEAYSKTQDLVQICIKDFCHQVECDQEAFKYDGSFGYRLRYRQIYEECDTVIFQLTENRTVECYHMFNKGPYIYKNTTEEAIKNQVENFTHFIDAVLRQRHVELTKEKIDEVILGGMHGNLRVINETISGYFNGRNLTINGVLPVDTIAYGAAVKGLQLAAAAIKQGHVNGTVL